jgi:DNA processing protein
MSIHIYTKIAKINDVSSDAPDYLQMIKNIADSPKRLWHIGSLPPNRLPTVAIVGSRKPTAYGQEIAHRLSFELASAGVVVVSGLALGIDSIAHRGALEAGGKTLAIMPCGLDRIYPASHRDLAQDIIKGGGALISEYEPGSITYPINFIARNRIVSGVSDGLLVIEASAKSGTMHTASFALDQGKSVMAVPGNITSRVSEGCHNLLKAGARLVTGVDDVLDELGLAGSAKQARLPFASNPQEQSILELIGRGVRDGDDLQAGCGLSASVFSQTLTMLEVTGKVRALGANKWGLG